MLKEKVIVWRIVAILCTLVWTIVLFGFTAFPGERSTSGNISLDYENVLYGSSICISFVLIFVPMKFYLYAIMCFIWGLFNIVDGGSSNGLLMYALGCLFAYKQGFFAKRTPVKYLILFLPLIAFGFQYRFGTTILVASAMDLLFLLMFFLLVFLLFGESFLLQNSEKPSESAGKIDVNELTAEEMLIVKEMIANKTFYAIEDDNEKPFGYVGKVDLSVLTVDEILIVKEVLEDKMLKNIARDRHKSDSVIKQQMSDIYKKLKIYNKTHLLDLNKDGKLIFPK